MTKYILNSGGVGKDLALTKHFFSEIVKDLGNNPRILICLFAYPREYWEKKISELDEKSKERYPVNVKPTFSLALPSVFEEQVKNSDVIYMYGGDDHLLQYWLKKFDIPKIWKDKVVATSSASSNAMSKHFWTCDWRECSDGLGILPIKFISHYESSFGEDDPRGPIDWEVAYKNLESYGDNSLPIFALKEGEFRVLYK